MGSETTPHIPSRPTQADLEPKQARIACVSYDNGRTPGSSSNAGGEPLDFVRFSWPMESKGLELNGQSILPNQPIGPTTGWTPQFTDNTGRNGKDGTDLSTWVPYFNAAIDETLNPDKTCAAFARFPAPTWRAVKITSVDPCFVAGRWHLCRLDTGTQYTVYPVLPDQTIIKIWCREVETKDGLEIEVYDFDEATGEFNQIEWPTWQPYQGAPPEPIPADCFIDCDQKFDPFIDPEAVSNCNAFPIEFLCVFNAEDENIQTLAVFQWDCEGDLITEIYTEEVYNASLDPNADPLDPSSDQYVLPEGASIRNCNGSAYVPPDAEPPAESKPDGVHVVCFERPGESSEKKIGYDASDFDPGDLEIGDKATAAFAVTVDGGTQSATPQPIDGFEFNELPENGQTRNFEACWTYDGTTPNDPIFIDVVATDGSTATISGDDLFIGSGGGESALQEFNAGVVREYLKEFCFLDAPNIYQNSVGETVSAEGLTRCDPNADLAKAICDCLSDHLMAEDKTPNEPEEDVGQDVGPTLPPAGREVE